MAKCTVSPKQLCCCARCLDGTLPPPLRARAAAGAAAGAAAPAAADTATAAAASDRPERARALVLPAFSHKPELVDPRMLAPPTRRPAATMPASGAAGTSPAGSRAGSPVGSLPAEARRKASLQYEVWRANVCAAEAVLRGGWAHSAACAEVLWAATPAQGREGREEQREGPEGHRGDGALPASSATAAARVAATRSMKDRRNAKRAVAGKGEGAHASEQANARL